MKIAIPAVGEGLQAKTDPRFGRCAGFVISDPEGKEVETIENPNTALSGGAGIQTAEMLAKHNVNVVVVGSIGPNAIRALNAAGIEVYNGQAPTIAETLRRFNEGGLEKLSSANVSPHSGMGRRGRF